MWTGRTARPRPPLRSGHAKCRSLWIISMPVTILYYNIIYELHCTILYHTILYYDILYHTMLFCDIIYWPRPPLRSRHANSTSRAFSFAALTCRYDNYTSHIYVLFYAL